jgi:Zn-dependent oligopeptidase
MRLHVDENPFFENWTTPFGLPPFDRIRPEHFPPAFDRGMTEQLVEIEAIAESTEAPSFANTVEAMERSGRLLGRVSRVFDNLDTRGARRWSLRRTSCGCSSATTSTSSAAALCSVRMNGRG